MNQPKLSIGRTGITKPPKICIYGPAGIGKSTFAKGAPSPIYLATEDRHGHLGIDAFEFAPGRFYAINYKECINAMLFLLREEHDKKTFVLDTGDWLQHFIYEEIVQENGAQDIQDPKKLSYQRGYELAEKKWYKDIFPIIQALNTQRKMWVILIFHSDVHNIKDTEKETYGKVAPAIHKDSTQAIVDFCDIVGFIDQKIIVSEGDDGKMRAKTIGDIVMKLGRSPAYYAKDSYGLPETLPFRKEDSWKTFYEALMPLLKKPEKKEDEKKENISNVSGDNGNTGPDNKLENKDSRNDEIYKKSHSNLTQAKQIHEEAKAQNKINKELNEAGAKAEKTLETFEGKL